jgi:hypothetical protein
MLYIYLYTLQWMTGQPHRDDEPSFYMRSSKLLGRHTGDLVSVTEEVDIEYVAVFFTDRSSPATATTPSSISLSDTTE